MTIPIPSAYENHIVPETWEAILERIQEKTHAPVSRLDHVSEPSTFANVYKIGNDRVLKLTTDPTDPAACSLIMGKSTRFLIRVHDVFRIRTTQSPETIKKTQRFRDVMDTHSLYGIVVEECVKLEGSKYKDWDSWLSDVYWMMDSIGASLNPRFIEHVKQMDPELLADKEQMIWLSGLANELLGFHIMWSDLHSGNIMVSKKRGIPVVIDLGASSSAGNLGKVDVVGKFVEAYANLNLSKLETV